MKYYLLDFEDSFTNNIACVLSEINITCLVVEFGKIPQYLSSFEKTKDEIVIILGPGPGHPYEYRNLFSQITRLLLKKEIKWLGICLGHQILGILHGLEVRPIKNPTHGISIPFSCYKYFEKSYYVQKYNSLGVYEKFIAKEIEVFYGVDESLMCVYPQGRSYQFHPESIGTICPHDFFYHLVK